MSSLNKHATLSLVMVRIEWRGGRVAFYTASEYCRLTSSELEEISRVSLVSCYASEEKS